MYKRFLKPLSASYFLFGPRGTGKSSWLRAHYPHALWVDLLDFETLIHLIAYPSRLREMVLAHPEKKVIVIDEVQKVPELLSEVHKLIEEKRGLQFILTGSSAHKLRRYGTNLLGGRALLLRMPPFYAAELGADFSLPKALEIGMVPVIVDAEYPELTLKAYGALYLKEEVQTEGLVRNIGEFARFLEVMSFSHAAVLNTSNIANECAISRKIVDTYLEILDDLLLGFRLPVYTIRAQRELTAHQKFYYFDAGVYRYFRPTRKLDIPEELQGPALEGLVGQHLKAWCEAQDKNYTFAFWRTRSKLEVDFVVEGPQGFWAIEVKNGKTISPSDLSSLNAFHEDYPSATLLLLYRGKERLQKGNILCLPVDEFLLGIHPEKPVFSREL